MLKIVFAALIGTIPMTAFGQTPAPSPAPAITCSPMPTPLPTPLVLPPAAPPQILAVSINEPVFHSGDTLTATVITSTNVAAVELRIIGQAIRFARSDFGVWHLSYRLPHIPRRYLRDYAGQIVAMNTGNASVARNIMISLR